MAGAKHQDAHCSLYLAKSLVLGDPEDKVCCMPKTSSMLQKQDGKVVGQTVHCLSDSSNVRQAGLAAMEADGFLPTTPAASLLKERVRRVL